MSNRVTMGQDDSMMLQRDTLPMQVLNKLMDWIMDGKLKMGEKRVMMLSGRKGMTSGMHTKPMGMSRLST